MVLPSNAALTQRKHSRNMDVDGHMAEGTGQRANDMCPLPSALLPAAKEPSRFRRNELDLLQHRVVGRQFDST
jgi:hypothetical protein